MASSFRRVLLLLVSYLAAAVAGQGFSFFPNNTLGSDAANLSSNCAGAIMDVVQCEGYLLNLITKDYYGPLDNQTLQDQLCNPACGLSLTQYHKTVASACALDPQPYQGLPATYFGDVAYATYNLTCLKDPTSGQYCTDYVYNAFANYTTDADGTGLPSSQLCSSCVVNTFRQMQSTSYSNYDTKLLSQWSQIQSLCALSYPTAVPPLQTNMTALPGYGKSNTSTPPGCLSGNKYSVVAGDNCGAIARSKSVATGTLITLNQLLPDCTDLQIGQVLCLPQTCTTYAVQPNDTCYSIASTYDLLLPEILGYNPALNNYCTNLIAGQNICVSPPGGNWTGTTIVGVTATQTAIYATATVAPAGPVAFDTTPLCGKYYQVQTGDYCQLIAVNATIDLALFEAINPSIDAKCDNLVPGLYYCVFPTADWNATSSASTTLSTVPPPTATPSGTTGSCYVWHTVVSGDYCALIESEYSITFAQLQAWNPSLLSDCSNLILGDAYCVGGASASSSTIGVPSTISSTTASRTSSSAAPSTTASTGTATSSFPAPPTATPSGTTSQCYTWYVIQSGDYCYLIETKFSITFAQLQYWNPSLLSDCSNLFLSEAYCVSGATQPPSKIKRDGASASLGGAAGAQVVDVRSIGDGVPVGWPYPLRNSWNFAGRASG